MTDVTALVLAAGAGRRYGGPKALARSVDGGPWLTAVTVTLASIGLESVAVLPHTHTEAADLLHPGAQPLFVDTFDEGVGASLRAALAFLSSTDARAALIVLVDQPTLPGAVIARLLSPSVGPGFRPQTVLRRAVFDGRPGHPVLIGREHWVKLIDSLQGDEGAGPYFREHDGDRIECSDLWDGADIDERAGG